MIETDQDLEIVRQQLARAESAFGALRREVLPQSEERFLLMAEAYVEQILALRGEIDAFLGLDVAIRKRAEIAAEEQPGR
jgi:hypothetical protein